jgi:uncharacterized protein (TIGR00255 family)
MILSLTGFGSATQTFNQKLIRIDIKAINSRQADIRFRMPIRYAALEMPFRKSILQHVRRGKIDVTINTDSGEGDDDYTLNLPLFKSYYQQISAELENINAPKEELAQGILRIYNVVKPNTQEISEEEQEAIHSCLINALDELKSYRATEGKSIFDDLNKCSTNITELLTRIETHEGERTKRIRDRIKKNMGELLNDVDFDRNRIEQEMIYYLEKLDISEEKVRLLQHCQYFQKTLQSKEQEKGKSLNFISQEIGREINTLGSKANDYQIQHLVIQMKEDLEKIKEQLPNVV